MDVEKTLCCGHKASMRIQTVSNNYALNHTTGGYARSRYNILQRAAFKDITHTEYLLSNLLCFGIQILKLPLSGRGYCEEVALGRGTRTFSAGKFWPGWIKRKLRMLGILLVLVQPQMFGWRSRVAFGWLVAREKKHTRKSPDYYWTITELSFRLGRLFPFLFCGRALSSLREPFNKVSDFTELRSRRKTSHDSSLTLLHRTDQPFLSQERSIPNSPYILTRTNITEYGELGLS